jgi:hypothetical protein
VNRETGTSQWEDPSIPDDPPPSYESLESSAETMYSLHTQNVEPSGEQQPSSYATLKSAPTGHFSPAAMIPPSRPSISKDAGEVKPDYRGPEIAFKEAPSSTVRDASPRLFTPLHLPIPFVQPPQPRHPTFARGISGCPFSSYSRARPHSSRLICPTVSSFLIPPSYSGMYPSHSGSRHCRRRCQR